MHLQTSAENMRAHCWLIYPEKVQGNLKVGSDESQQTAPCRQVYTENPNQRWMPEIHDTFSREVVHRTPAMGTCHLANGPCKPGM